MCHPKEEGVSNPCTILPEGVQIPSMVKEAHKFDDKNQLWQDAIQRKINSIKEYEFDLQRVIYQVDTN